MQTVEKKCPLVRFKGFTDDWEQRKLGDVGTVAMCKRIFKEQTTDKGEVPFYKIGTFGGKEDAYISRELFEEFKQAYSFPEIGDVLISASGSIGRTIVYNGEDAYFQDSNIVWLDHDGNIDNKFLEQFYSMFPWTGLEGSTIKRLYNKNILETEINFPSIKEQKKIGEFFKSLDNLITFHQRKLDQLTALKKAMLGKMFPQEGERVPEVRFSGFTDDWEQCKLGDIGAIQTCKRIFKDQTTEKGDIPFYKNGTLGMKADAYISRTIFNEYKTLYPYPEVGDVLMSVVGSIGRTAEYKGADEYFQDSNIVWLKTQVEIIDRRFLKISYQIIDWIIEGSTIKHLYNDNILLSKIWIPSIKEQKRIGVFFEQIDNLITHHQHKLTVLQQAKKSLLQKMFI